MESLKVISLFAGAGGLDLGFEAAGFEVCVAVEEDPACCDTLRANKNKYFPGLEILQGSIQDIDTSEILRAARLKPGEAALVIGGPPCQPFSLAGKRMGLEDPRGLLVKEFIRVVREALPYGFVMENVKGLLNWSKGQALELIVAEATRPVVYENREFHYTVTHGLLNAVNFGVPQFRERVFIVGNRMNKAFEFPDVEKEQRTVGDAILDLPPADAPSDVAKRVSQSIKGRIKKHGF